MIILEKPYVSDVLLKTVETLKIPVLKNEITKKYQEEYSLELIEDKEFIERYQEDSKLYTNSENSLEFIYNNLPMDKKIKTIHMFKNKAEFRSIIKEIYPDFYYTTISYDKLPTFDISNIKLPVILKPNQGFFSLGVYTIYTKKDWTCAIEEIKELAKKEKNPFNEEVISHSEYIIEEYITGEEYAVDGYYNEKGNVVILNILKHIFASKNDVSDRLYITSTDIIKTYFKPLEFILTNVNKNLKIKNFPFHFEVRIDGEKIVPIEMNPLRFAGWCTTDIAFYSYGINTYQCFFQNQKPDWEKVFAENKDVVYAMVIMDKKQNSNQDIGEFGYGHLKDNYKQILKIREVDYQIHSVYGFMFLKIQTEMEAWFQKILNENFDRFLS